MLKFFKSTTVHQLFQVTNKVLSEQRQLSNQVLPAFNLLAQLLEESPTTRSALTRSLGNVRHLTLESTHQDNNAAAELAKSERWQTDQKDFKTNPQNILCVRKTHKVSICDEDCVCKCHIRRSLGDPVFLSRLLGHGYVETAGSVIRRTPCDVESCRAHAAPRVSVQYRLPPWLASRMIFLWFTSSPPRSPELLLRVSRVLEYDHSAIRAVYNDDVEQLKAAIMHGDYTPYDVNERGINLFEVWITWKASAKVH